MIYAVISDIHANLTALEAVLADAKANGAGSIVSLGDIVGYGPMPAETLRRIMAENPAAIAGNHDDAVSGRVDEDDFIDLARDAVLRHREALSKRELSYLASLPYTTAFGEAVASHGDFTDPARFLYIENEEDAEANFEALAARLAFVGHTHVPAIFLTGRSGAVYKVEPQDFTLEDDKRYIVNPGSVGYPREKNGQCFSSYVLYDSEERSITFRFLPFAVSSVMQRGENPKRIKKRVLTGAAIALSAAVAAGVWYLTPKEEINVTEVNVTEVIDDPALVVDSRILPMSPDMKFISPRLVLDAKADSAPVDVEIKYLDAGGAEIYSDGRTVKSAWGAFKSIKSEVRENARQVKFVLKKQKRSDNVVIESFDPALSPVNPSAD